MGAVVSIGHARSRRTAAAASSDTARVAQRVAGGERLYTAAELGMKLGGRSKKSLQRDRRAGMPAHAVGNSYRYLLDDVLAWQKQRQENAATTDQSCA